MLTSYFDPIIISEWVAFLTSIFLLNKATGKWRWFIVWLLVVIIVEANGWYINTIIKKFDNSLGYNILLLTTDIFLIVFFAKAEILKKAKKKFFIAALIFFVFFLINILFFQKWHQYNSYSETFGDIILIIISCYFFFILVRQDDYINVLRLDFFWLATGVLFASIGSAVLFLFAKNFYQFYLHSHFNIAEFLNYAINIIFYSSLIAAFICRRITK